MRNAVIGLVIGIVAGIVLGTSVIAPRIKHLDEAAPVPAENAEAPAPVEGTVDNAATVPPPTVTEVESVRPKDVLRLRMASAFPENLPLYGTAAKRLERSVWRISDGTFELRFHPPGALVGRDEALKALASGAIDAAFAPADDLAALEPALALFGGPPMGASVEAYLGWMSGGGGRTLMEDILGEMKLQGLLCGIVPNGAGGPFSAALTIVDDLKGRRIRADGLTAALYKRLGAETVDLSIADAVAEMEAGTLYGAQISTPHVDATLGMPLNGAVYYVPGWRTPATAFVLIMAIEKWDGLGAVQQTRLRSACAENVLLGVSGTEALQFEALKKIVRAGADVRPWPAEIEAAMREAWKAEATEQRKKNPLFDRVLASYARFVKGQSIWEELAR